MRWNGIKGGDAHVRPRCLAKVSEDVTNEAQWTLWHD